MADPKEIGELWHQVNKEMHDRFRHAFRDQNLPPMVAMILLRHINEEPGVTVSELARRSGTVKSHVSKLVDQLVQQGFVEKRPDPEDQRLLRLYVTPAALQTKAAMEARVMGLWSDMLSQVPAAELDDVARSLRVLLTALQKTASQEPQ